MERNNSQIATTSERRVVHELQLHCHSPSPSRSPTSSSLFPLSVLQFLLPPSCCWAPQTVWGIAVSCSLSISLPLSLPPSPSPWFTLPLARSLTRVQGSLVLAPRTIQSRTHYRTRFRSCIRRCIHSVIHIHTHAGIWTRCAAVRFVLIRFDLRR